MKLKKPIRKSHLAFAGLILLSVAAMGTAFWRSSGRQAQPDGISQEVGKEKFYQQLRRGIGTEVTFANAKSSRNEIRNSVDSVADFIYQRSSLRMSAETKRRIEGAEGSVLNGSRSRISLDQLSDTFVGILVGRLATFSDDEAKLAISTYRSTPNGEITSRASAKWGLLSPGEFTKQLTAGREWSRRGDEALNVVLRKMITDEVKDRVTGLRAALPEQFGKIDAEGVTPLQAIVIGYSVVADDPLSDSQVDLDALIVQQRMLAHRKFGEPGFSGRAYGPQGELFSSPAQLFFDKKAVNKLLEHVEGGQGK